MRSKNCLHKDNFGRCNQPATFSIDDSKTDWVDFMTGRSLPWNSGPEIIQMPMHPLVRTNKCFYHTKQDRFNLNSDLFRFKTNKAR